jgi:hypothetical protein
MASRIDRLLAITPRDIHAMFKAEDWRSLRAIDVTAFRVLYLHRTPRSGLPRVPSFPTILSQ